MSPRLLPFRGAPPASPPSAAPARGARRGAFALLALALAACGEGGGGLGPSATGPVHIIFNSNAVGGGAFEEQIVLPVGDSARLGAQRDGAVTSAVSWRSRNEAVATVTEAGLVLARAVGSTYVVVSADDHADSARVTVSSCAAGSAAISLLPGQVRAFDAGQGADLCLDGGGAAAEFVLVPYVAGSAAAAVVPFDVTASSTGLTVAQATALDAANTAALAAADAAGDGLGALGTAGGDGARRRDPRFDARLRGLERTVLEPRMAALRDAYRARGGATSSAPSLAVVGASPRVGDVVSVNADPDDEGDGCSATTARGARIAAISDRAIVLADTLNPANGFTTTEYRNFAAAFDTLAWPVDVQNFGEPSDIDRNGKVLIFFTAAVNALTPRNADYYVGGFFHPRDLYPKAATRTLPACAGSNEAEMFYMMVPDPQGTINGNRFERGFVSRITVGTIAHEFQHLINAGRRTYVNTTGTRAESVWLNEGLSHVAEELLFFRASGLPARSRVTLETVRESQRTVDAYNAYANPNMSRLVSWLRAPETSSPFASNDELGTRGATWQLLRYAADQSKKSERDIWFALVNGGQSGLANLRAALGITDLDVLLRDWAVANAADGGAAGTPSARFRFASWDFAGIIKGVRSLEAYPLQTRTIADGQRLPLAVNVGTAAYVRVPVAAGHVAYLRTRSGTAPMPSALRLTVVRVR